MGSGTLDRLQPTIPSSLPLLPKDRTILEREVMQFRPFGLDEQGRTIRDLSGMSIRAIMLDLERTLVRERGAGAGSDAVLELCRLLNQRIKDPVYHVTPDFLKNPWNSYSYEFAAFLYEFCEQLTGNPNFIFNGGMEKVSPIIQVLARPFSLEQIYGMFPYFGNKFASGSVECRVVEVTPGSATLAMRFSDHTLRQFGPFRRRCTYLVCQSAQGIFAAVPARVHGLPPATLTNLSCVSDDDEWCQWLIRWNGGRPEGWRRRYRRKAVLREQVAAELQTKPEAPPVPATASRGLADRLGSDLGSKRQLNWVMWSGLVGLVVAAGLRIVIPSMAIGEIVLVALIPVLGSGLLMNHRLGKESRQHEALIHEQMTFVESRHEELREAYLEQEQTRVELRRKVTQLTALHRAGLLFSATVDRDSLLQQVLEALTRDLHYDRAMVSVFDPARQVIEHVRVIGVSPEVQAFAQSCQIPVHGVDSPEGAVVLEGRPILIEDIRSVWQNLHPLNRRLAEMSRTKALIVVPLKMKDRILGTLTVDRSQDHGLTQEDLELMTTVANQVAIALDNAAAYRQIEEWNAGLEQKVRERTAELEQADRLRSQFLSHVSHELKTPLTSIKGFLQNLLDGLTGPLTGKQQQYLSRMLDNSDRLIRMIEDLLDRTRIESGRMEMLPAQVDLGLCLAEAVEQLRPRAVAKRQNLDVRTPEMSLVVWADRDRLIQVVVNLLQNAIKFTPEAGNITIACQRAGHQTAKILVRDSGPGIPSDCLEKIFDPFFRVQQGQRNGPKGLGLGLSIVKTLVELQGGTVAAGNHPEGGAEMSFTVPIRSAVAMPGSAGSTMCRKILVVDDDPDIRQLLLDRLSANGYLPHSVVDGRQALEAVWSDVFGGVILDIGIGQPDGLEVLRQIRLHSRIPVIMITASGSQELAVKAIGMGAQAYLLKPFDGGELQQAVDFWFRAG